MIAGIDEVGRGCLAGPVVAAVVVLNPNDPISGLADSKLLSARRRAELAPEIQAKSLFWSLGRAEPSEIDRLNIRQASLLAMVRAVRGGLNRLGPVWIRVDGADFPRIDFSGEAVIRGDRSVPEISAASIIAKVFRDREMMFLDRICPGFGLRNNKGYPTREHLEGLKRFGSTLFHRQSFAPVRQISQVAAEIRFGFAIENENLP